MATIDIRDGNVEAITQIVFAEYDGDNEFVEKDGNAVKIRNCTQYETFIYIKDIPNLIKALQKAQELWT